MTMFDERFMMHQLKSMKIATRIGAVLMGASMLDKYFRSGFFDWQLFAVMMVMAVVKVTALFIYKRTN